ncbi:protein XRP2 [Exaiptasia diaphana]|uniref:Protein XRP2 n=1 Tax=Exaiptasia diaphana TaxID=2652724 RepID=A0A913XFE8_EXADI|nr:protein XRP2 [Exaiptasia diaphana]KXJ12334.1 Protein XRP2 [Exaiptasia diaphana]
MGCLESKETEKPEEEEPKVFSWDRKDRPDPKDFTIADVKDETTGRLPGKINGQQFIIRDCQDSNIYLFDHSATITVDDCTGCSFFLGPIKGSVYFRDCKDCKVVVACQQFRTRDCKKMEIFLCCATQPIIESSSGMKFGCFQFYYPELEEQFKAASISVYNNNWSNIHDFTPAAGETTWSLLPEDVQVEDFVPVPTIEPYNNLQASCSRDKSSVPLTLGTRRKPFDQVCLVIFFQSPQQRESIKSFLSSIKEKGCVVVQTKEISMRADEISRVIGSSDCCEAANQGALVGLEINGSDCVQSCRQAIDTSENTVYISPSAEKAIQEIDQFYNFVDMSMT